MDAVLACLARSDGSEAISDLLFANLWLFRRVHDYRLHAGPRPCISGKTYDGTCHLIPLFDLCGEAQPQLAALLREHGAECFYPVSGRTVAELDPTQWCSHVSRDDADYLFPAENFLLYRGSALNKKRNLAKQLRKNFSLSHQVYQQIHRTAALQVLRQWLADKLKSAGDADELACAEALSHAEQLGLKGFVHTANGEAAGFVLAQQLQPGVMVVRFAKGLDRFKGIYQHMFQHFCQHAEAELGEPVQWLNFEQDMGLANFRRTKLSYRPAALLPKYRVSPRQTGMNTKFKEQEAET
ncbi:phosphatidylglycerol lysyltransferase domain-containing protein [Variovorax sp. CF313]|uniref:phosphatidylglycerol lysyltransferase domain-containing protein n=1 Tax=Variovorax sp. CF313 TaxID=1144315 RepID=UPI0012F70AAA|nr:phosphatidylglycerol lysyltransferase domain-containing protein [Variovorax sp. CF313]